MRIAIGAAVVGVVLVVVLLFHQAPGIFGYARSTAPASDKASPRGTLTPEAVLSIAPRIGSTANLPSTRKLPPSLQEYQDAKSYANLYARLSRSTNRTGEEDWMLAQILHRCARFPDDDERVKPWKLGGPEARTRFAASLPPNDPDRDKRLAAFDAVNFDACTDLPALESTRKDLRTLLQAGADAGDPKARASLVQFDLSEQNRGPDGKFRYGPDLVAKISDSQIDTLKQAIGSGDPYAVRTAMSTLSGNYANFSLRDVNDLPLNFTALWQAGNLMACNLGLDCGPNSQVIVNGCAFSGYCAATNLNDYMMYYMMSPNSSQLIASYESAIRNAVDNGDWSYFHFYPGPSPWTAAFSAPRNP
jgi:hypothetical protein